MSVQASEAVVRRFFEEVWNKNDAKAADEIVHQNYRSIENQVFPSTPGPQIVAAELELFRSLYDQLNFQIERMFTDGDTIVTIWKASGISKEVTFFNRKGEEVPKTLEAVGVSLSEVKEGKIAANCLLWPRNPLHPA
jgi:limonene-1,2-epoxide hydrolase